MNQFSIGENFRKFLGDLNVEIQHFLIGDLCCVDVPVMADRSSLTKPLMGNSLLLTSHKASR